MALKTLMVQPTLCTGCRSCEMACSLSHEGKCSPALSRVRVIKFDAEGRNVPSICAQCTRPECLSACAEGAIRLDAATGAVLIDENLCTGCRSCIPACPHSQIGFHPEKRLAFKCDLCGGDPQCARFCPTGALAFVDVDSFLMARRRALLKAPSEAI
jgi:carbon-monoxide dehydrogenase iron sulfur subunit